jgi:hypothetical protein
MPYTKALVVFVEQFIILGGKNMSDKSNTVDKKSSKNKAILVAGFIWLGLGSFGLIFDPSKTAIIISQFIAGLIAFVYYFISKSNKVF